MEGRKGTAPWSHNAMLVPSSFVFGLSPLSASKIVNANTSYPSSVKYLAASTTGTIKLS